MVEINWPFIMGAFLTLCIMVYGMAMILGIHKKLTKSLKKGLKKLFKSLGKLIRWVILAPFRMIRWGFRRMTQRPRQQQRRN